MLPNGLGLTLNPLLAAIRAAIQTAAAAAATATPVLCEVTAAIALTMTRMIKTPPA
jgi:hypothetical protein